ncbi:alpha-galactosidase [Salipaludibacillus neizhouensis]|uniref:Alpha-galactosidase n=1 Tax=Salipaludibacillus neizhouensis TaxID=885475 RepID=A0A3A9K9R5_9BACI|nr:alpha-galactosidase [Salipaludibacillus neizhouensis]RKL68308.1 alpha-galactosidase [Salipaludibacillus neizhouensis]
MIQVNNDSKEFHLSNGHVSYIFHVMKNGQLGHLYYGKSLTHNKSFSHMQAYHVPTPNTAHPFADDPAFSLETSNQEYPSFGTTDFREPAISLENKYGSTISDFNYQSYEIYSGKKPLQGLPSTYVTTEEEAQTLVVTLWDEKIQTELRLSYTIFTGKPVITRSTELENKGKEKVDVKRLMSLSLDLPESNYEMVQLSGAWSRERHVKKRKLESGIQAVSSLRGASSHAQNPFLALTDPSATEVSGEVMGFNLVYSSNFLAQVEVDHYDVARVTMGIHPFNFKWELKPKSVFQTPEVVMVYSDRGLNGMSAAFHDLYRKHLIKGYWQDRDRPVMLNNWEATYFDFNETKLLDIAQEGQTLGIELFVLDDGWFGRRDDDTSSLGDWFVDKRKLPNGLHSLALKIREMGLEFGLWFEPEMVSKESELMKTHPDWIIQTPERVPSYGRNQLILDFSREEVVDYIFERMASIIEDTKLTYIKWDMNRNITEAYSSSLAISQQGEFYHRYILGVYKLYDRLTSAYQHVLFESCAGGGGRFDPGMLYYAPQAWTSDDTDAVERLKIQYGTSLVYPINSMGSHVSAAPNHQTSRSASLTTRGNVAYFGTFGYELDPLQLSEEEKKIVKNQIRFFKEYRQLIRKGEFIRIKSPFEGNETAWMIVNEDRSEALVGYYKVLAIPNPPKNQTLRLSHLKESTSYAVTALNVTEEKTVSEESYFGDELMNRGVPLKTEFNGANHAFAERHGDFQSDVFYLKGENK